MSRDPRTGNWLYRRTVPPKVGLIDGSRRFIRSFETTDLNQANRRWSTIDAAYEAKLEDAKRLAVFRASKDKRREKFWLSVARWIAFERQRAGGQLRMLHQMAVPTEIEVTSHTFIILRNLFTEWAREHDPDALAVYQMGDYRLDTLFECGLIGAWFVAHETQSIEARRKSVHPVEAGTQLRTVLDRFKAEKKRSSGTFKDIERAVGVLEDACYPDKPSVEGTTKEHMRKFRDHLGRLEWTGRTRNKTRANLSSLYGYAKDLFLIEVNPVQMVAGFDEDDSESYLPFSDADLKLIFGAYDSFMSRVMYWLPLIGLYTGARQGEIGQLDRKDVYRDEDTGLLVFRFCDDTEGQSIKNDGSLRKIPVPQAILDLGFEKFVMGIKSGSIFGIARSPSGAFPDLSKTLVGQIRAAGINHPLKVFHSFRHTLRTRARSFEIPEEAADFLAGHAPQNVGRKYGTHELPLLKELIDRITYPISVPCWTDSRLLLASIQ